MTSIFRSAVTGDDGTIDSGYLAMYAVVVVILGAIPLIVVAAVIAIFRYPGAAEIIQSTGIAVGAICGGAGVAIGAVGAFRAGDKPHAQAASTTTTRTQETTTSATPGASTADPLKVAVVDMPSTKTTRKRSRRK